MKPWIPLLAALLTTACQSAAPPSVVQAPPSPGMVQGNAVIVPGALTGPTKMIVLMQRQGAVPQVTIDIPSGWRHQVIPGEDIMIHAITAPQLTMRAEYWGLNTNLSCHLPSCGLRHIALNGRQAQINMSADGLSWRAFVTVEPGDAPGMRGIRLSAQCSTRAACDQALAVLGTLRTS